MHPGIANDAPAARLTMARLTATARALYGHPHSLGLLMLIAFLAGLVGPFGTGGHAPAIGPFVYWALIVFGTTLPAKLVFDALEHRRRHGRWRPIAWSLTGALIAAAPVSLVVWAVGLAFGFRPHAPDLGALYGQCALVIATIDAAARLIERSFAGSASEAASPPKPAPQPAILNRLAGAKRGRLIRVSAQDHYVEIVTDRGTALVPMRFRDAIGETAPAPGAQVHRSHWVATDAVLGQRSVNGAVRLQLSDGGTVPVGRTFRHAARQAGILV